VRLQLRDGTEQMAEITAGGGYYSQSSPAAFFGWPDGNPPRRLVVRWPDGTSTEHELSTVPAVLTVQSH
jgi:enediyne biosynthesis protein E4